LSCRERISSNENVNGTSKAFVGIFVGTHTPLLVSCWYQTIQQGWYLDGTDGRRW
jgi:hypothetical protein